MAAVGPSDPVIDRIFDALGLKGQRVVELELRIAVDEPVRLRVVRFVDSDSVLGVSRVLETSEIQLVELTGEREEINGRGD